MATVTLKAHFDGKQIVLDEPFELPPNAQLEVTVVSTVDLDREAWSRLGGERLAQAYGNSEPEYSAADLKK